MGKRRMYIEPRELTPKERLDRVIKLLAEAAYSLAVEEIKKQESGIMGEEKLEPVISAPIPLQLKSGPVPFGQKKMGLDRVVDECEVCWIRRVQELKEAGMSNEKIAKRLNEEDKESRLAGRWYANAVLYILRRVENRPQ